ncbi:MAG: hypothetical protein ACJAWQ_001841 [Paraglaciecola sp.]|jgi:hypothetical protein
MQAARNVEKISAYNNLLKKETMLLKINVF